MAMLFTFTEALFEGVQDSRVTENGLQRQLLLRTEIVAGLRHYHAGYMVHSLL